MRYVLMMIFGILLGACGINVIETPMKAIVLILFFAVSILVIDILAGKKS